MGGSQRVGLCCMIYWLSDINDLKYGSDFKKEEATYDFKSTREMAATKRNKI